MRKAEFLAQLRDGLDGLPQKDIEERLTFYGEMMEDRMEEGFSEEEAVAAAGPVREVIAQIIADIPLAKIAKARVKPKRRMRAWEIVLLVLGSPIWLSLGISVAAVIFSLYASVWAVVVSLWAVPVSLVISAAVGVAAGIVFAFCNNALTGIAVLGASAVCVGLSIFLFFGCGAAVKGILRLTKKIAVWIKNIFIRKGEAE